MLTADSEIEIPVPKDELEDEYSDDGLFKISSWGADLSFRELISRYDDNELVKPELQRNYVWDKNEASRFIDSVLLGLPVPSIFLAKTKDEKLLIIDGYQRLMTVRDYVKGIFSKDDSIFKLSRSKVIHDNWRGKAFLELDEDEQRRIRNTTIHAIIFMQQHPAEGDTSLYQVFERINSSGRTLMPQEIRNCVYQGPINTLLFELNKNPTWRKLWGKENEDDRMRDLEYILRFFALSTPKILDPAKSPSAISLKKYLNTYMESVNETKFIDELRQRFNQSIEYTFEHFGVNAFHNISSTDYQKLVPVFSPTVFDSVLIAVDLAIRNGKAGKITDGLEGRRFDRLQDSDYQKILTHETMKVSNIQNRINRMYQALFEA